MADDGRWLAGRDPVTGLVTPTCGGCRAERLIATGRFKAAFPIVHDEHCTKAPEKVVRRGIDHGYPVTRRVHKPERSPEDG